MSKVITNEDENFGNSQEELQKFVQEQWKHSEKNRLRAVSFFSQRFSCVSKG